MFFFIVIQFNRSACWCCFVFGLGFSWPLGKLAIIELIVS